MVSGLDWGSGNDIGCALLQSDKTLPSWSYSVEVAEKSNQVSPERHIPLGCVCGPAVI